MKQILYLTLFATAVVACNTQSSGSDFIMPVEIIDLGTLVTEDLPERFWGSASLRNYGFEEAHNTFEVSGWKYEFPDGVVSGANSYYTLFNHGGPHVDAPNHLNLGDGLDSYHLEDFAGPLKVIDVSAYPAGRTVTTEEVQRHRINPGDIVLIYTAQKLPRGEVVPQRITLTQKAAEFLATLPIRAFGTDAFNVESESDTSSLNAESATERIAPIHYSFLSRGIPVYEQLMHVEMLLEKQNMYFVGPPLNIKGGDGMMVRPVVLVYE